MKGKWNKCLFCFGVVSTPTTAKGRGRPKKKTGGGRNAIKLVINYLIGGTKVPLNEGQENEEFAVEKIFQLEEECGGGRIFKLCQDCESVAGSISELQLQLEVTQMKIINLMDTLRKGVLRSCSKVSEENQIGKFFGMEKRIMEVLRSFQTSVMKNEVPTKVPFVLLEKCTNFRTECSTCINLNKEKIVSDLVPQNGEGEGELLPTSSTTFKTEAPAERVNFVKTEPQTSTIEEHLSDVGEDHSFMESLDLDLVSPSPPKLELKEESGLSTVRCKSYGLGKRIKEKSLDSTVSSKKMKMPKTKGSKSSGKKTAKKNALKVKSSGVEKGTLPSAPKRKRLKRRQPRRKISCDLCPTFLTRSFHKLEFHLRKHETGEKRFKCDTCPNDVWLSGEQLYHLHVASHSGQHRQICDICNEKIDHFLLLPHMETCSKGGKLFTCANCSYVTISRDKLLEHFREHDRSGQYFCDVCEEEMETRTKLQEHLFEVHGAIQKLTCPREGCEATFLDKFRMYQHEQQHDRNFHCSICSKSFPLLSNLKVHERVHTGELPVPCTQCEDRFKDQRGLTRHLVITHGAPKFQCQLCPESFLDNVGLFYHMRLHTGTTFPCDQCGLQFVSNARLQRHMGIHSTQRNFVCEQCGKDFQTKGNLASHRRTHAAEKRYKCEFCEKAFNIKKYLTDHRRTHTGERPFVCGTCGASFTQAGPLNAHKKKHL